MDKETLNYYEQYYFANEEPVPFTVKNGYTLYIRPVKVKMFSFYKDNIGILLIDKNRISDVKIISMSYLQYLVDIVLQNDQYQRALVTILNISLGDDLKFTMGHENSKAFLGVFNQEDELLCKITPKEFDKICDIILNYNDKNYDARYISDDMRKAMEDYYRIKTKDDYVPTLEEQKTFVSFKSGLTLQQINDMSYRHFEIMYKQCIDNDLFFSQKIIQASEKYKVNDNEMVYPLFKKPKGKFDFLQDADAWEKKVSAAANG